MRKSATRREGGFTLLELLVVMAIFSIVLAITSSLFWAGTRVLSRETTTIELQADLAGAKNMILDDLSIAGYRPDVASPPRVPFHAPDVSTSGSADTVAIFGDVNSDNSSDLICYRVNAENIERSVQAAGAACGTAPWLTLAEDVESFDLQFLDAARLSVADADVDDGNARYVRVDVRVGTPVKGGAVTKRLVGEVALRNWE